MHCSTIADHGMRLKGLAWIVLVAWQVDPKRLQGFYTTGSGILRSKHQQYLQHILSIQPCIMDRIAQPQLTSKTATPNSERSQGG